MKPKIQQLYPQWNHGSCAISCQTINIYGLQGDSVIVWFKLLKLHSNAKIRAPAYSQGLCLVRDSQKEVHLWLSERQSGC